MSPLHPQLNEPSSHAEPRPETGERSVTPRERAVLALRFALGTFGPLLAYMLGQAFGGPIVGVAAAIAWAAADLTRRAVRRQRVSRLFWLTTVLTILFGSFDLALGKIVLFRFEAVVTNLLTACYFGASIMTGKSVIEELYESSRAASAAMTAELKGYLRFLSAVWCGYFLLKSAVYYWLALTLPLTHLVLIRSVVGTLSLGLLLGGERLIRARLFRYLKGRGYLAMRKSAA